MRAFIAIDTSDEVKDYLYNFQKKLKKDYVKVSWVHKKNLHATLKFIGEADEKQIEKAREVLRQIKFRPFKLKLKGIGFFPSSKEPRVIWIGLVPEEPLIQLQRKIDEELLALFAGEQKFQSHLTIGRIKFVKKADEFAKNAKELKVDELEFEVKSFQLMKSELSTSGPSYSLIEEFKGE